MLKGGIKMRNAIKIYSIKEAIRESNNQSAEKVIPTGFDGIDRLLNGGLRPGTLNVIAARPGMGKTVLSLQTANNIAGAGNRVVFFSCEETAADAAKRMVCLRAGVSRREYYQGNRHAAVRSAEEELSKLDLRIVSGADSVTEIYEALESIEKPDAVFIDFLQLIDPGVRVALRKAKFDPYSAAERTAFRLKQLAREYDIPIVLTSQLSRRSSLKPQLADLRFCGNIEQHSNVAMFIHREGYSGLTGENAGNATIIVAKNYCGDCGMVELVWENNYGGFANRQELGR